MAIKVDQDTCNGSGNCVEECPEGVFELKANDAGDMKAFIVCAECCTECMTCIDVCPTGAISMEVESPVGAV